MADQLLTAAMVRGIAACLFPLLLAGCVGPKEQARSTFDDIIGECAKGTVRYQADASGRVRQFRMTCEVKP